VARTRRRGHFDDHHDVDHGVLPDHDVDVPFNYDLLDDDPADSGHDVSGAPIAYDQPVDHGR
jgi:hypothetical protein